LIVPDPQTLKPGDRIRILCVPIPDLRQREREIASGTEMPGWTADTIERIIDQAPIVQVQRVDDDGCVWYEVELIGPAGDTEYHSLIIYADETWEHVTAPP
jgi:protein involved in polysaccharide export with SLBB domain